MQKISTDPSAPRKGFLQRELHEWFGNPLGDFWGGVVTTLALIPEVIGFTLVAGIPPYMGLFACIILPGVHVLFRRLPGAGHRRCGQHHPGGGAAGYGVLGHPSRVPLRRHPSLRGDHVYPGGSALWQPDPFHSHVGDERFVNGFATVIFISQAKLCFGDDVNWLMYVLIAVGIAIIYAFPCCKSG